MEALNATFSFMLYVNSGNPHGGHSIAMPKSMFLSLGQKTLPRLTFTLQFWSPLAWSLRNRDSALVKVKMHRPRAGQVQGYARY